MRLKLLLAVVVALALAPATAHATIVFESGRTAPSVWAADNDGSNPRKLAKGSMPRIAPDGSAVVYVTRLTRARPEPELREIPVDGGTPKTLVTRWQYGSFDWSDDGRYIVAAGGRLNQPTKLYLIDRQTGTSTVVARGFFDGASFSPDSTQLVFAKRDKDTELFPDVNLFTVPVTGGTPIQITTDGKSEFPVWGPQRIAYSRYHRPRGKHAKDDGPKVNLFTINPDGSGRVQLTHDKVPFLLFGLTPTAWSQDGTELLAQFSGQDTTYAVTVDPTTGTERLVAPKRRGFVGTALSKDGKTILGFTSGFDPDPRFTQVATTPYAGGRISVLIAKSSFPDWDF